MVLPIDSRILSTKPSRLAIALLIALLVSFQAPADTHDYQLGAGDEIRIQVYQEDDLSMVLRLDESGTFDYPYLGTITAKKRTLDQLQQTVTEGLLQDVLVNPNVSVSIVKYRNFYIGGEVKKSGSYPYQPGLTIKQAVNLAGGVTEWASSSKYEILREGSNLVESVDNSTAVRPGDTITILEGLF